MQATRIRIVEASCNIDGIRTSQKRMDKLMTENSEPETRDEAEIVGYREALDFIHEQHTDLSINPEVLLQLQEKSFHHSNSYIESRCHEFHSNEHGESLYRWEPTSFETSALTALCKRYEHDISEGEYDPVLLAMKFVIDFNRIFPSLVGRRRLTRLLMTLLLLRSGFDAARFVSIESWIAQDKRSYYETLGTSTAGWRVGEIDYEPFIRYMLRMMSSAVQDLSDRLRDFLDRKMTKPDRIAALFERRNTRITKRDLVLELPDISETTIERTLHDLLHAGRIRKVGGGRSTAYLRVGAAPQTPRHVSYSILLQFVR